MSVMELTEIAIAATQALIAFSLLFLTLVIHSREGRLQREWKSREEEWNKREANLTREIHSNEMQLQRVLKVHDWGRECILTLAEADHLCLFTTDELNQSEYAECRTKLLRRLSALVDQGRMFFENEKVGNYGSHKPTAYKGLRPKVLDPLIAAYLAIKALHFDELPDKSRNKRLFDWRRDFVSLLQEELNPDWIRKATDYSQMSGGGAGDSIDENSEAPSSI